MTETVRSQDALRRWGDSAISRLPNTAWTAVVLALLLGGVLVVGRLAVATHGDETRFIVAGTTWSDPAKVPSGVHVFPGNGYDGQFFYRLSLSPSHLEADEYRGIRFDVPVRSGRIGYPVLAWLVAFGGRTTLVPWAMIGVNLAALAALAAIGARLARRLGHHAAWGALFCAYWGFTGTLGRDLSEIVAAALTMAALLLIFNERYLLAAAALSGAVMTREQAIVVGGCLAVGALWTVTRRQPWSAPETRGALVLVVAPVAALIGWNAIVYAVTGHAPLFSSSGNNLGPPFAGMFQGMESWLDDIRGARGLDFRFYGLLHFLQLAGVAVVVVMAASVWRRTTAEYFGVRLAFVAAAALFVLVSGVVFREPLNFRISYDLFLMAVVLLLGASRALWSTAAVTTSLWLLSAGVMLVRV